MYIPWVYKVYIGGGSVRKTSINVTPEIDKMVEEYKRKNGITSWTAALFELARKGFEISKQ